MTTATGKTPALTDEVPVPSGINVGLTTPNPDFLTNHLGKPREFFSQECMPVTNKSLAGLMQTANVGPFTVTGLRPAVASLRVILAAVRTQQPNVYAALGTAGMLCCRQQRGSAKISSHSWGTAIDLKLDGKLDVRGNNKVHYGLTLIAPLFNNAGWTWGAAFRTEDAMHFEVSKNKLEQWKRANQLAGGTTQGNATLRRGDKGPRVFQLQTALNKNGAKLKPDSDFGTRTEEALRQFQKSHGLDPDGVAGPKTLAALRVA